MVVGTAGAGDAAPAFGRGVSRTNDCPIASWHVRDEAGTVGELAGLLSAIDAAIVVIASDQIDLRRPGWLWEAVGLLELHPDAAVVCGRLIDPVGTIVDGAGVAVGGERRASPLTGRSVDDPGPFALALKPHTIDVVQTQLLVADRVALLDALADLPSDARFVGAGTALGRALGARSRRVVFTPMLEATTVAPVPAAAHGPPPAARHGLAGFLEARTLWR
jgi:hypothetical protein